MGVLSFSHLLCRSSMEGNLVSTSHETQDRLVRNQIKSLTSRLTEPIYQQILAYCRYTAAVEKLSVLLCESLFAIVVIILCCPNHFLVLL